MLTATEYTPIFPGNAHPAYDAPAVDALRAAELLEKQAFAQTVSQQNVLNLASAEQTVLAALNDPRPDVV